VAIVAVIPSHFAELLDFLPDVVQLGATLLF
jgi:hypothetical protein